MFLTELLYKKIKSFPTLSNQAGKIILTASQSVQCPALQLYIDETPVNCIYD